MENWAIVLISLLLFGLGLVLFTLSRRSISDGKGRLFDSSQKNRVSRKDTDSDDPLSEFETNGVLYFDRPSRNEK